MISIQSPIRTYRGGQWVLTAWIDGDWLSIRHFAFQSSALNASAWLSSLLPDLDIQIRYR